MAWRPNFNPFPVINNVSMATSIISEATIVSKLSMISYEATWSGTSPVGTVSVQGSNDFSLNAEGNIFNSGTWTALPLSYMSSTVTAIPISGNTGNGVIDIAATGLYALRFIYTAISGTGNITVTINAKVS